MWISNKGFLRVAGKSYLWKEVGKSKYRKCSEGILIRLQRISREFEKIRSFHLISASNHPVLSAGTCRWSENWRNMLSRYHYLASKLVQLFTFHVQKLPKLNTLCYFDPQSRYFENIQKFFKTKTKEKHKMHHQQYKIFLKLNCLPFNWNILTKL